MKDDDRFAGLSAKASNDRSMPLIGPCGYRPGNRLDV